MQITAEGDAREGKPGIREGKLENRHLLKGRDGSLTNYSMHLNVSVSEYAAPRHRHNFDQVRYNVRGEINYGGRTLGEGCVAYFPESTYYGPQVRKLGSLTLTVQFGGATGNGYISRKQQADAHNSLSTKGTFEKGVYKFTDADGKRHNKDAFEAVFEEAMNRKLVYAPMRYDEIIIMDPKHYEWIPRPNEPGISEKMLGKFNERGTDISFVQIDSGATLKCGVSGVSELLFLTKGSVAHNGISYDVNTAFGVEPDEGPATLTANQTCEILYLRLPRF